MLIIGHLSSYLICCLSILEGSIDVFTAFLKWLLNQAMLLFSRKPPRSTNFDPATMSSLLCTFYSLSFCIHIDMLLSMDNILLSIYIDRSYPLKLYPSMDVYPLKLYPSMDVYPLKLCSSTDFHMLKLLLIN